MNSPEPARTSYRTAMSIATRFNKLAKTASRSAGGPRAFILASIVVLAWLMQIKLDELDPRHRAGLQRTAQPRRTQCVGTG